MFSYLQSVLQYEVKESDSTFYRDQQHSHWGINLVSYEKSMNGKVRMTVAIPAEHESKVDESAYRRIKRMSFRCLHIGYPATGNLKGFIDDCKDEVIAGIYLNL